MSKPDRYAVMGNPIAHSMSPEIHQAFAKQCNQNMTYEKILVPLDGFEQAVREFQQQGGKGLNITLPFKEQAFALADQCSGRAQLAGAVNTLILRNDEIIGDNTDGTGLVRDLINNHQITLKDKRVLIIGASGAARGIVGPLCVQQPKQIHIANRTAEKALALASYFNADNITGSGFAELNEPFDLIINATPTSMQGEVPSVPNTIINNSSCGYDLYYSDKETSFVAWCKRLGAANAVDGFGMLLEQAAEAFYLWRAVRPDSAALYHQYRCENK